MMPCGASGRARGRQVQDEAAGLVVAMVDPREGERMLDACAAPGGKSLFAAARLNGWVRPRRRPPVVLPPPRGRGCTVSEVYPTGAA